MSHSEKAQAQVHLRLTFPNGGSLDENDIELIETIKRCRSILGTSKLMGLSYRKTWLMTDALNRTFESKVVDTFPGRRSRRRGDGLRRADRGAVPVGGAPLVQCGRGGNRQATASLAWDFEAQVPAAAPEAREA